MTILTYGDSHSQCGWRSIKKTKVLINWLGPKLCYTIGSYEKWKQGKMFNFGEVKDGDSVVFCFGEIDCRAHIHKHATKDEPVDYKTQINGIVERYFETLKKSITFCKKSNVRFFVYNVVPPPTDEFVLQNKQFPTLGNQYERITYVKYFNTKLKEYCDKTEFTFFDIYNLYSDKDGFMNMKYCDGTHITDSTFLEKYCADIGIL